MANTLRVGPVDNRQCSLRVGPIRASANMGFNSQGTSRDASFRCLNEKEQPDPSASPPRLKQKSRLMDTSVEMCLRSRGRGQHRP